MVTLMLQRLAPVHNGTLGFKLATAMARISRCHQLLATITAKGPVDLNHHNIASTVQRKY